MTKLYTDTSANLPLALLREYDIAVIPFSYTVNGVAEDYRGDGLRRQGLLRRHAPGRRGQDLNGQPRNGGGVL